MAVKLTSPAIQLDVEAYAGDTVEIKLDYRTAPAPASVMRERQTEVPLETILG